MKTNKNFVNLNENFLFIEIAKKIKAHREANPNAELIRLGIGDVTRPITKTVTRAMSKAVREMGCEKTFHGYGDEQGYGFLRQAIADLYAKRNMSLGLDEIFISDGAKSDLGNILEIFGRDCTVLIPNPVYPAYVDANIMNGNKVIYMDATPGNNFLPLPKHILTKEIPDIVYLCSPNNPTGAVYTHEQLKIWVDYAVKNGATILFDSAYATFIRDTSLPCSIYEIPNANKCAIEISSFSKMAGFTGLRCGWTVVPKDTMLNKLWLRRQTTKFNGASFIVQRGAEAALSIDGQIEGMHNIGYYMKNARIIADTLQRMGIEFCGGGNAPYIWLKTPNKLTSWQFFDYLLEKHGIIGTPGVGFGSNGEGWFRLSAFAKRENVKEAMSRFATMEIY
ncbi:MAG: LL-diaminopimelate aminotransferase [Christensenellaceae bacterium]|jgi:LL-diaminopimelate aminotransferase|nr:LL-diaminopimelate aminotransferase [Christensenellaceae bacterium]